MKKPFERSSGFFVSGWICLQGVADSFLEVRDPVGLPGLAAIRGIRLLPMGLGGGYAGPGETHADGFAAEGVVRIEGADAAAVIETTSDGRVHVVGRIAAVEAPDVPLPGLGIVGAHGEEVVGAARLVVPVLGDVAVTAHDQPVVLLAWVIHPFVTAGQTLLEDVVLPGPAPDPGIEGMQAAEVRTLHRRGSVLGGERRGHGANQGSDEGDTYVHGALQWLCGAHHEGYIGRTQS